MIADSAFYQFEALSPPRPWRADSHQCMCVAVHGRTGTFLNEIEISGHSSVAWENGRWGTKLAYGLWVADAAAPLIGAAARGRAAPRFAARSLTVGEEVPPKNGADPYF